MPKIILPRYNTLINHLNSCKPCWKNELNSVSDQQPLIFVSERARNSSFENEIVAVIECKTLSTENENELEVFKKPIELPIEQNVDKLYAESLLDQKRTKPMSHYGDLKWIPPTYNLAE